MCRGCRALVRPCRCRQAGAGAVVQLLQWRCRVRCRCAEGRGAAKGDCAGDCASRRFTWIHCMAQLASFLAGHRLCTILHHNMITLAQ